MTVVTGWIALPGAEYEGLWNPGEPITVHFNRKDAEEECKTFKSRIADEPDVLEVAIDLEALQEVLDGC